MMANAGTPHAAASLPNQCGGSRPNGASSGPSTWFMSPASESNTQRQSTATPTPASTLGRYHAARKNGMPSTLRFMRTAAASASPCPSGTATAT